MVPSYRGSSYHAQPERARKGRPGHPSVDPDRKSRVPNPMTGTPIRLTLALAALATLAACSGKVAPLQADEALQRDLEQAGSTSLELVPNASRTAVVSAIEQQGTGNPAPGPPARARAPRPRTTPRVAPP